MPTIGIIAEYNPFHAGHAWQIQEARRLFGEQSSIVCVMSGCFCQRGIPALLSPRRRARMALAGGADLVLLLPTAFATASAETFAKGAVSLLVASGVIEHLIAGSELADEQAAFNELVTFLHQHKTELRPHLQAAARTGLSPHDARQKAVQLLAEPALKTNFFDNSNSILAIEYALALKALGTQHKPIEFCLLRRQGNRENESSFGAHDFVSALALREYIAQSKTELGAGFWGRLALNFPGKMPLPVLALLLEDLQEQQLVNSQEFDSLIKYILNREESKKLSTYRYMGNGLAERLGQNMRQADFSLAKLLESSKARNFTVGRIQRALLAVLLGLSEADEQNYCQQAAYIFPLAYNRKGKRLLARMGTEATLPLAAQFSALRRIQDETVLYQTQLERRAYALYAHLTKSNPEEYLLPPLAVL